MITYYPDLLRNAISPSLLKIIQIGKENFKMFYFRFSIISIIAQNPFSVLVFTVKRCTLRSIGFFSLIASVWNLLFLVFLYCHTLNNSIYIWMCAMKATSEFYLGHAIFVIDQSLKLFWPVCWKFLLADHLRIGVLRSFQTQND